MILRFLILWTMIALASAVFGAPREESDIAGYSDSVIRSAMKKHKIPGVSFVLADDQEIVAAAVIGFADLESRIPVERDTIFKLWSVSKAFTAIEIMRLASEGVIGLDDPVTLHIEDFTVESRFHGPREIAIGHILTHRSGLPRNDALAEPEETLLCEALEDKAASLRHAYLAFPVGRRYHYSNTGFDLLGRIVELKREACFPWYMKTRLLEPMGMETATFFSKDLPAGTVVALGYEYHRGKYKPLIQYDVAATPSSNLYASIEDLSAFLTFLFRAIAGKEKLLPSSAIETMFLEQRSRIDDPQSMGFGWKQTTLGTGDVLIYHDGGPTEGVGSLIALIPAKKIGIALAGNSTNFGSPVMVPLAVDIIDRYLGTAGDVPHENRAAPAVIESRTETNLPVDGRYIAFGRPVEVRKGGKTLRIEGVTFDLLPAGDGKYRMSHWLYRIGLGWVIPLPVDIEIVRVSFPGEDSMMFHVGDLTHEYCPRYPSLGSFPMSPYDLAGDYRMLRRRVDGSAGEGTVGSASILIDDEVLTVSGDIGPVTILDKTTLIIQSGPFAGETMKLDPASGVITHQHIGYVPDSY